ncbi:MAG TPA: LacI family transcriptional regulator, partial [Lachnospiraceae bacterium]|nr:LacI family transcriptional regulator [Lachnospiraceae bacterium]
IGNQVSDSITTVQVNEMEATIEAVELILSKGYQRIIFVCPPLEVQKEQNIYVHEQRLLGFQTAVKKYPELIASVIGKQNYLSAVEQEIQNCSDKKIAFLCSGDSYALDIMRWASQKGLSVPKDFGLMGFDDINVLEFISPKLTTVSTNLEGVAKTAVSELIQQIEVKEYCPKSIFLNYKILDRETL